MLRQRCGNISDELRELNDGVKGCLMTPEEIDISKILTEIQALAKALPEAPSSYAQLASRRRSKLRNDLEMTLRKLEIIAQHLDPVALPELVFDPTAPKVVGKLVADTLLLQPCHALKEMEETRFYGAGVYAIYYRGNFATYLPVAGKDYPLYVGKADPAELHASGPRKQGKRLSTRLRDHARSIGGTVNLNIEDFDCRYLVVRSAWVETAEDHLIEHFKPVWNKEMKICYGFGKHGDNPKTRGNKRSPWDTLHPGREWATREGNAPSSKTVEQIKTNIQNHFKACGLTDP